MHNSFELICVLSGEMEITVDNKIYNVSENESVLIFPHQLHSVSGDNSSHMVCIFSPETVKAYSVQKAKFLPENNKFVLSNDVYKMVKELTNGSSNIRKKGVMYCVCDEFDAKAQYINKSTDDKSLLYSIFEFVEQNYANECTLEHLAGETSFSYYYLSRYFKKTVGISFNSYVNRCRISKACYDLKNTDCTILRCAVDCGYANLRSFNRNFKLIMGVTPVEYREKA